MSNSQIEPTKDELRQALRDLLAAQADAMQADAIVARAWRAGSKRPEQIEPAPAAPKSVGVSEVVFDVIAERYRQISEEGCTPEDDDRYTSGELAHAAASYALAGRIDEGAMDAMSTREIEAVRDALHWWPWDHAARSQNPDRRRSLVKAAALLLAEIDRYDRAQAT